MGFGYAAVSRHAWERWLAPVLALGAAIVVHAVHNFSTSMASELCWPFLISLVNDWGGVIVILVIVLLSWDREKRWMTQELWDEVLAGTLSEDEYDTAVSYTRRVATQWEALSRYGLGEARRVGRLHHLATELAFAKHRSRASVEDTSTKDTISRLRGEIRTLRALLPE
jgi:hypothetical protein